CLAGIPGLVGATPVQNVGAYGQEVAETVAAVRVWDRAGGAVRDLALLDCGFAYRDSAFKHSDRYVVLSVTFALRARPLSRPVRLRQGLRQRPGAAVEQAHAGADQPGRRDHRGARRPGPGDPRRGASPVRRHAHPRAPARRRRALTPGPGPRGLASGGDGPRRP